MRKLFAATLLGLSLTAAATARTVPSCPAGSQQHTWKGRRRDNIYSCKLPPVKADAKGLGLGRCLEWEGNKWGDQSAFVPCGSSASTVSDADSPDPDAGPLGQHATLAQSKLPQHPALARTRLSQ
jgi:hypothetical protein